MDSPLVSREAAVTAQLCPACGQQFAPGTSPAGLCPACLLKNAFTADEDADAFLDDTGSTLPEGVTVGPFVIAGLLGRGGMSAVYRAHDVPLERTVALKVLPQEFLHDRTFARRFEHEARIIAGLAHDHIVPIYASGIDDGIPWMSMRLMAGGSVGTLLVQRRLEPAEAIRILRCVADALDYAHARGVVHRDIKPTNILLDGDGAYMGDFGLAQMLEHDPRATRTGTLVGTPHYIAPERALGERADHRCDIYSLGIVAYEMFVGRLPFAADSPVAVLLKHVHDPLPAPPAGLVPPALAAALQKAAAKDPAKRWPSAGAFVSALEGAVAALPTGTQASERSGARVLVSCARLGRSIPDRIRFHVAPLVAGLAAVLGLTWWMVRAPSPHPASIPQQHMSRSPKGPANPIARTVRPPASRRARPPAAASASAPAQAAEPQISLPATPTPPETAGPFETPSAAALPLEPVTTVDAPTAHTAAAVLPAGAHSPAAVAPPSTRRDDFTPAKLLQKVNSVYPAAARAAELEGTVIVQLEIGTDGKVHKATVKQLVHKVLADAALKAVWQYRYAPAIRNGVPIPGTVTEQVAFKLTDD